ncbi:MAG: ABC transporter permease [Gemmatimonadaceae bacterium]
MQHLMQDLRHALRAVRKSPGFAATAVLTLALSIGANTALFSVVSGVLLNPLPYPGAGHLAALYQVAPGYDRASMSYPNFLDWQRASRTFASMAIFRGQDYNFSVSAQTQRVSGSMVSADYFRTLGQTPVVGRDFTPTDDRPGGAPVVILGGGFWERAFGSSRSVVGTTVRLNDVPYTVIGVMPAAFTFRGVQQDVYVPIGQWTDRSFLDRGTEVSTHAVGRLKTGVTFAQATADMDAVAANLTKAYPEADKQLGIVVVPLKQDIVGSVRPYLLVLLGAVGFLLLIACANVANLLLARATGRTREFAIRGALGAGQGRLVRQLLTESAVLAVSGGAIGLALAYWGTGEVLRVLPSALPRASDVQIDGRVLAFTIVVSVATGVVFGLAPALTTSRVDLNEVLKQSGRGGSAARHRTQRGLVALEIALALMLLVGAGLMGRTLQALWRVDLGFRPDHAITFILSLPATPLTTSAQTRARVRAFDTTIRGVPGIEAASVMLGSVPMLHDTSLPFWIEGTAKPSDINDMPQVMCYFVEAGFRQAMGLRLLRGRFVTDQDNEHSPIVVDVDDDFARQYFPNENPIGQRMNISGFDVQATVVGVVAHVKQYRVDTDPTSAVEAQAYYPFMQIPEKIMPLVADAVEVVLRTRGDPTSVMPAVRVAVHRFEPQDVVYRVQTVDALVSHSYATRTLTMLLLTIFAVLALLLACVGIYGVVAYLVRHRAREIGIRVALGAGRGNILRLVIGEGLRMAAVGTAAGAIGAIALTRLMTAELFGVSPHDPVTFVAVAGILVFVAVFACYWPAREALRVDPIVALKSE